jgi:hypothetical protein
MAFILRWSIIRHKMVFLDLAERAQASRRRWEGRIFSHDLDHLESALITNNIGDGESLLILMG